MSRDLLQRLTNALPRSRTLIFTPTAVSSGGDLLPSNLQPDHDVGNFRTVVQFGGPVAGLQLRVLTGVSTIDGDVLTNVGTLAGGIFHIFDFPVNRPLKYNLVPTVATTLTFLQIHETGNSST